MMILQPSSHPLIPADHEIEPHFQPIVSLQTQSIYGYEVLGRRLTPEGIRSLGPFFKDTGIADDVHLYVDRMLRSRAFERVAEADDGAKLFVNLKPSWIYRVYRETGTLPTLQLLDQHQVPAQRLVAEITEEDFTGDLHDLSDIVEVYRRRGCQVAIDDVGSGYSTLDRIAVLRPDILKLDLTIPKKSAKYDGYRALMRSFADISAQMGASLLVEGVETAAEVQCALEAGARYVQGYWFSPALPEFVPSGHYTAQVQGEMDRFRETELERYGRLGALERELEALIDTRRRLETADEADAALERMCGALPSGAIRLYACREDGLQLSSNHVRQAGGTWSRDETFRGANWLWRPYFLPNVMTMKSRNIGLLSRPYTDLDSSGLIQTYSCPVGADCYLFIDLET